MLKGLDEIDWFTDRPDRATGVWSPKKLLNKWDQLFGNGGGAPNAQATFKVDGERELVTFEISQPSLSESKQTFSFIVEGIGEKIKTY